MKKYLIKLFNKKELFYSEIIKFKNGFDAILYSEELVKKLQSLLKKSIITCNVYHQDKLIADIFLD